ncbi:hypothetical protein [Leptospira idonii]|uniref:Nif11 family protein n=1 Tax=Leptospira idonii TaxID=1193500 RepID=A0A4R9LWC8_9LEPT|nr:hypothetical protein [Leptospira idonii]TGN17383.1 hypothetical protein EHS15_17775 [Leptospira idonii]
MKSFLDFVLDASKDVNLAKDLVVLLEEGKKEKVTEWFHSKGYELSDSDASKLVGGKDKLTKKAVGNLLDTNY